MNYMLMLADEFVHNVGRVHTDDKEFVSKIFDTENENPSDDVALQFSNKLFLNKKDDTFIGGVSFFSDTFVGLARALIGINNNFNDIGTYMCGEVKSFSNHNVSYMMGDVKSCIISDDVTISKISYETTEYCLTNLYNSYALCKAKHHNVLTDGNQTYQKCDKWYLMAAIMGHHHKLLTRMLDDGIYSYGDESNIAMSLAILSGDIKTVEILLRYQVYTHLNSPIMIAFLLKSKLEYIRWYRKAHKAKYGKDVTLLGLIISLRHPSEIFKYLVTIPWMI